MPTWSDPVGLGAKRTFTIAPKYRQPGPPALQVPFPFPTQGGDYGSTRHPRPIVPPEVIRVCAKSVPNVRRRGGESSQQAAPVDSDALREALLSWYAKRGRELPWRLTRDPYAILVSETMLQQTQVARVLPRYRDWLERWPTVESLAAAPLADVIRAWQGLGYNRRAVNLHRAAQLVAEYGWPADLTSLPGVGRYTADAVACFALGADVLPRDVNVRRVLDRSGGSFGADCAQALMDLGATVCLARVPRCGICPLGPGCASRGRRYEPARRQKPFEGSFRQRRGRTLRLLAASPRSVTELDAPALEALAADGLVRVSGGLASLP